MTATDPKTYLGSVPLDKAAVLGLGVCVVDGSLRVREWNEVLAERGISRLQAIGKSIRSAFRPMIEGRAGLDRLVRAIKAALEDGRTTPLGSGTPLVCADPVHSQFHAVVLPLEGHEGDLAAIMCVPASESGRVRRHYERILDSATDGVMIIDPDRRVRSFNRACGELLGRSPEEVLRANCVCGDVVNCHMEDGTSMASPPLCPARELFEGKRDDMVEEMLATNARGKERWIETHYSTIHDDRGNVEFVIGIIRDVHERRLLEQRLAQAGKLAALGQLTAGIAHEIKNPLGIILSSVEVILDENRPREMHLEAAQFIKDEVRRLDSRLAAFLAFARPNPAHPEPVVLNGLIRRGVKAFQSTWLDIEIAMDLLQPEPIIQLDPDHFNQVMTNLILNAAEAMEGEGRILVRTRADACNLLVEVHDSGPGVPEQVRKKVFDPFFTTKADGTGLGLSVVYNIATSGGGDLRVGRSEDLGGALFTFVLPFHSTTR